MDLFEFGRSIGFKRPKAREVPLESGFQDIYEKPVLGAEMMMDEGLGGLGLFGDLKVGRSMEALLGEKSGGDLDYGVLFFQRHYHLQGNRVLFGFACNGFSEDSVKSQA